MKRELNVRSVFIGLVVLGISQTSFSEAPHAAGGTPLRLEATSTVLKTGNPVLGLAEDILDHKAKGSQPIKDIKRVSFEGKDLEALTLSNEAAANKQLEKIENWVAEFKKFREDLDKCSEKDATQLKELIEAFSLTLREGVFGKVEDRANKSFDEKKAIFQVTQIQKLLKKRGEVLVKAGEFARPEEKKVSELLDKTLVLIFGADNKASFGEDKQKANAKWKERIDAVDAVLASAVSNDMCKIAAASTPSSSTSASSSTGSGSTSQTAAAGQPSTPPLNNTPEGTPDGGAVVDDFVPQDNSGVEQVVQSLLGEINALSDRIDDAEEKRRNDDAVLQQFANTVPQLAADIARAQQEAALAQQQNNDDAVRAALDVAKQLGQANNEPPVITPPTPPVPPPPFTPPQISTGGSEQQPFPQQYPPDMGQQQGPMPMMMPPFPQPQQQPQIYVAEPSRFQENDEYRPRPQPTVTASINPQLMGNQEVSKLLQMVRNPYQAMGAGMGMMGQGVANAASYMANRISGFVGSTRSNVQSNVRRPMNPTAGPDQLALTPAGRSSTVPAEIRGSLGRF